MQNHDIIVAGASAGGIEALQQLVAGLPPDLPASLLLVVHVSTHSPSLLAPILDRAGPLPALVPQDGAVMRRSHIYVAPPDHHLIADGKHLRVVRGPKENRHRPAIDPLFRSAAWAYGPRVVGVILTGMLDDGTAGLWAVKSCGGVAVVQDPETAPYPDMPRSALRNVDADHVLPVEEIPSLLVELARQSVQARRARGSDALKTEIEFAMTEHDIKDMAALGKPTPFTCPSCHGALWELQEGELVRYRCHVGHAFGADSLLAEQSADLEEALYSALRTLEEKAALLRRLAERFGARDPRNGSRYHDEALRVDEKADTVRRVLLLRGR